MSQPRFYFVEASKVRTYHATLVEGYLAAIISSEAITGSRDIVFAACGSLYSNIGKAIRECVAYEPIPVVDQDKHYIVRKSLLEFWVVLKYLLRKRKCDILFVSCVLPPALLLLEFVNFFLRKGDVFVVIHGEIEALFTKRSHWRSIGYWALRWLQARPRASQIAVVVIDDFIKARLIATRPDKFRENAVYVAHHPVTVHTIDAAITPDGVSACFIGYRTASKGFDRFESLAKRFPDIRFVAIGGGKREELPSNNSKPITSSAQYLEAISECSLALFPYTAAYDCSLSAAVLDALSTGVHVVATPRAAFVSLANTFGPEFITIYRSDEALDSLLRDTNWVVRQRERRTWRLRKLASSKYALASVRYDFEKICGCVDESLVVLQSQAGDLLGWDAK